MALQLKRSDLYQNGRVIEFANGEQLLIRNTLPVKQDLGDSYVSPKEDDQLPLLAFNGYVDLVENANQYWWLLADRNNVFDPLQVNLVDDSAALTQIEDTEIVIPNILKQQPEIRGLQ